MRKFLLPLLFLFLMVAESIFVQLVPNDLFGEDRIIAPHFLFPAIMFLMIYVGRNLGLIYGAVFGLLVDVVYVEVIGIYLFIIPVIVYLASKLMQWIQTNIIVSYFVTLLGMALLEVVVYGMNYLIHVTTLDFMNFFYMRFLPTLAFNAAFLLLAAYPFKRWFEKYAAALKEE